MFEKIDRIIIVIIIMTKSLMVMYSVEEDSIEDTDADLI